MEPPRWPHQASGGRYGKPCAFLENFDKTSLLGYARAIYLKHSTRPGIAADFAAINNEDSLEAFFVKHEYFLSASDIAELEARAVKIGLIPAETLAEVRELMKARMSAVSTEHAANRQLGPADLVEFKREVFRNITKHGTAISGTSGDTKTLSASSWV